MTLFLALVAGASAAARRALIITASSAGASSPLLGTTLDAEALSGALHARGFSPADVQVLDTPADPADALRAIDTHLGSAPPGSHLLLHYSGHGQQITDDDGDEPDGYDEALVLPGGLLRDDDLGEAISALRQAVGPSGSVTVTIDACHATTATRSELPVRTLPAAGPPAAARRPRPDSLALETTGAAPLVVLSAAQAGQPAHEIYVDGAQTMGAFTAALAHALHQPAESWMLVHDRIRAELARTARGQQPAIEGASNTRPFGTDVSAVVGVPVDGMRSDGRLRLRAGHLAGLAPTARVEIHTPGARPSPETLLVTGTVEEVSASSAWVRPDRSPPPEAATGRAHVIAPAQLSGALQVRLALDSPRLHRQWWQLLAADPLIEVVSSGGQRVLRQEGDALVLSDPTQAAPILTAPLRAPGDAPLWRALQQQARSHLLQKTDLYASAYQVTLSLEGALPGDCAITGPRTDRPLRRGETVRLSISHEGTTDAWLSVVHIDPSGLASVLLPAPGQAPEQLRAGQRWLSPVCWTATAPYGTEQIKVFATRNPLDLERLLSDGAPSSPQLRGLDDGYTQTLTYRTLPK